MVTFKMGDRFITKTFVPLNLGSCIESFYTKHYKLSMPDIGKELLDKVDNCDVIEGSIFRNRDTGDYLNFNNISSSCRTLLAIALDPGSNYYYSNAYCGSDLWDFWLPKLVPISNAKVLIERGSFRDNVDYSLIFSERLGRNYLSKSEVHADFTKYCIDYADEIEEMRD